jgi:hypothetical protein
LAAAAMERAAMLKKRMGEMFFISIDSPEARIGASPRADHLLCQGAWQKY